MTEGGHPTPMTPAQTILMVGERRCWAGPKGSSRMDAAPGHHRALDRRPGVSVLVGGLGDVGMGTTL